MHRAWALFFGLVACESPAQDPPQSWRAVAEVSVTTPWRVVQQDADVVALGFDDTPHGVRVFLGPTDRWPAAGVSPVVDGETVGTPLVGVPGAIGPTEVAEIRSEGHDLVVRFSSQPLNALTVDADAPSTPALTWVRLRPRNGSWRIVVDGLADLGLPGSSVAPDESADVRVSGPHGTFTLTTNAPLTASYAHGDLWTLTTEPSLRARQPYPRTAFTWQPDAVSP